MASTTAPTADHDLEVLVVEDNPVYSAWLAGTLRQESRVQERRVQVRESGTIASARLVLAERRVHAVLLDLNLPDSSGLESVTALTAICPDIAIIVVSANDDEAVALKALSKGAQEYIFKGHEHESTIFRTLCRSMERKNVELQLALAQEQAANNERMAAIGLLASGVAHEYNNLGAVISGNAELILAHEDLPQPVRRRAERIQDAAARAAAVTGSLIAYVRGFRQGDSRVLMQEVIQSTWHLAESTITRHGISGTIDLPSRPVEVVGNASILGQVLLNLLINACHAMADAPHRRLSVRLSEQPTDRGVVLTVDDTGHGIAAEHLERVFMPFHSTKTTGSGAQAIRGTGLGLAVCRTYVTQHGGTITVTSREGSGSSFRVWLPRAPELSSLPASSTPVEPPAAGDLSGRRVLVVDDELVLREFYRTALVTLGAVVSEAGSVSEARALLAQGLPDVVLTDWRMPGENGRVLVEHLLTVPPAERPAIVVISGNLPDTDDRWLATLPGVQVLGKPVSLRVLRTVIAGLITRR